jgi:hypothetical protein
MMPLLTLHPLLPDHYWQRSSSDAAMTARGLGLQACYSSSPSWRLPLRIRSSNEALCRLRLL